MSPPPSNERQLFLQAAALPASERPAFLDQVCGQDAALRSRLIELLQGQEELGAFLETPALDVSANHRPAQGPTGTALIEEVMEKPGDRIGRYKLLQNIGEGGCGVVYMAEQEEPVRRRVALKVIKPGMDTKSVVARFEAERQALAMMDHPNIAKFHDAGVTGAAQPVPGSAPGSDLALGRPYFVMELVRGVRITDYCDQNKLPTDARLELFRQVCHAINHAHQKGIIHRDIKPSNILVTQHDGRPTPKIIDFGIAKATEHRLTDKTLFTQFATFIGTPAYMSPEQAEMSTLDVDTRSDIYSLGVLLYELLTGSTPFDAETLLRSGLDECRRTIREEEPLRPSTRLATMVETELTTTASQRRVESARLIHQLKGDLDWVAMKCLEKDRTRRYASANDLALDIGRYLQSEPVEARPPSNLYRLEKLVRRHRTAVAAAAAIAGVLVAAATVGTWLAVRATRAEHQARIAQFTEAQLRQQAESERSRAEREGASARLNEYVADINLAQQSVSASAGNLARAQQLLAKHRPQAGEPDLRGFEWRYLWHLCQGDEHVALPDQDGPIQALAFGPDGRWLAVGMQTEIAIYQLPSHVLITNLAKGGQWLVPTPDSRALITTSGTSVRIWDTTTWSEIKSLPNNSGPLSLSADGRRLLTLRREGVTAWDTATWEIVRTLEDAIPPMALSPDGQSVVADSVNQSGLMVQSSSGPAPPVPLEESTNLYYRVNNLRPAGGRARPDDPSPDLARLYMRMGPRQGSELSFSPDGKFVAAARNSLSEWGVYVVSRWDTLLGEQTVMPRDPEHIEHTGAINALAFSRDGRSLATASSDHSIRIWDFLSRQRVVTLQGHGAEVRAVAFSPDGRTIASGARDGTVKLWPIREAPKDDVIPGTWQPLAFSRDSRTLAAITRERVLVFLNLATREPEKQFGLDPDANRRIRFGGMPLALTPDLQTIAFVHPAGDTLQLINTLTYETNSLALPDQFIEGLLITSNGRTLVTMANRGRTIRVWDRDTGTNDVLSTDAARLLLSPDDRTLAVLTRGATVQVWDLPSRSLRTNIAVEVSSLAAAFSPDNRHLALAGQDDVIRILDLRTARVVGTCTGHKQRIGSVAFTTDGKTLASVSEDSTLKFWNVASQQELLTIRRLGGTVRELLFSPDGRMLVGSRGVISRVSGLRFYRAPSLQEIDAKPTPKPRVIPDNARPDYGPGPLR